MISLITRIQVEGNDTVSFLNGTNYIQGMSQIMPQVPTYISYAYDSITITQDGSKPFQFSVYTVTDVGGNTFNTLNFQDLASVVQAKTIEIYRLLVTSIFKGCCECGNAEPECSIQYTSGNGSDLGTLLIDGADIRINYFTANNQDFTGFWPIIQDGSWIFIFSKTDPTVYGVFQLSNYSDGGTFAQFDITLLAGTDVFPEGTELCVDVTSVGGSLVQGWQDTLIVDSVLTQDNTVDGGNFDFVFDNNNSFTINSPGGSIETDSGGSSLIAGPQSITVNFGYIDIITPDYASASTGWVLALDASGHVEYVEAGTGTISSIGLFMPPAFTVSTPNPLTSNGSFTVTGAGTDLQYIDGTGNLQTFPTYTVENGLHAFGGVPGEAPPDPFLFHLGGLLIEDTVITATNGLTEYVLGVAGTVNQDTRQPLAVSNLGLGGTAVFADYGAGFRPNPTVQMLTDNDLYQPILELTMQGNLPNLAPVLANRISLLRLKYDGAPANARTAMDFSFRNNDPNPNLDLFPAVQLTAEVTNFTVNNETANLELMIFQGGSQQVKLIMEGKGQLWLNEYGANVFSDGTTNINNALTYVLSVDNLGRVWKKLATGGGTVTSVGATGLLTTTATNPFTTSGVVTSQMASGFLVGRYSPGTGVFQQITIGDGLTLTGDTLSADGGGATYDSAQGIYKNTFLANDTFELGMDSSIGAYGTIPFLADRYIDVDTYSFNISSQASNRFSFLASGQLQMLEYNNSTAFDGVSGPSVGVLNVDNTGRVFVADAGGGTTYDSNEGIYKDTSLANDTFMLGAPNGSQGTIPFTIDRYIDTTDQFLQIEGANGEAGSVVLKVIEGSGVPVDTKASFISATQYKKYAGSFTGHFSSALLAYSTAADGNTLEVTNIGANGLAAIFQSQNGPGIQIISLLENQFQINGGSSTTPAIYPILDLENLSNLITPANGEGVSITMSPGVDAFGTIDVGVSLNAVISDIGTVVGNDSVVDFRVDTLNLGTVQQHTSFIGSGQLRLHEYGQTPANFPDPSPVWALGVDASGNVVEFDAGGGPGTTYTVNNGLTENPANNFQLGGLLIQDTVVSGDANTYDLTFDELNEFYVNGNNKMQITSTNAIGDFSQCYVAPFSAQLLNVTAGFAASTITAEAGVASMEATPVKILLNATEMQLKTPAVVALTAVNGQVLTLLDATTGEAEWQNAGGGVTYDGNEGVYKNTALANDTFQLGYLTLADSILAGNQFSVDRFVDTGVSVFNVNGTPNASNGVIRVINKSSSPSGTYGIYASNNNTVSRTSSAIFGQGGNVGIGVLGTTNNVLATNTTRAFGGSFGTLNADTDPAKLLRSPLNVFATRLGGGVIDHGAQILYTLNNDAGTSFDAGGVGFLSTSVITAGDAETSKFFVSTKELGIALPTNKLEIDTVGQARLNEYGQTPAQFYDPSPVWGLGVDATGKVVEIDTAASGGIPFAVATAFTATPNTYTTTIPGVTGYTDGDAYIIRFNTGNESAATLNINGIGAKALHYNNAGALIGGDIWDGAEMLCVYNFLDNSFDCIGTSPNSLYAYITNNEATSITKGQAVYAFSGSGNRMTVKLARANTDATSAQTIGIVFSTSIGANQRGIILIQGYLTGLTQFPTATWSDGDPVYLSPTTPGAFSHTKPLAPEHLVYLGVCATASNGSAGRMYVRIQNGYEMNELHDVASTTAVNKDVLYRDTTVTPNLWKPASIPTILGATTVGTGLITIPNPSTVSYIRIKADNTVDTRTPAQVVADLGISSTITLNRNFADTAIITGTTAQTIIFTVLIPANTFLANDYVTSRVFVRTSGTGGTTYNCYVNTSATIPVGGTSIAQWASAANQAGLFERNWMITSIGAAGNLKFFNNNNAPSFYSNGNFTAQNITVNTTIDQYLVFTATNGAITASTNTNGNLITILR